MFLNYSTSINEVIGKTDNGSLIFLYGHVKDRYEERINRIRKVLGMNELKLENLMKETVKIINEYYFECRSRNQQKVRHVIRGEIKINVGRKNFIIDLTTLVAGSEVKFSNSHPYVIEDQYKHLIESGELMVHDTVLAVETINATVRFADEEHTNFTHQPVIFKYKLPNEEYKVNTRKFLYMIEYMIHDKDAKLSNGVRSFVNRLWNDVRMIEA